MSVTTVLYQPWKKERHRMTLFPVRALHIYNATYWHTNEGGGEGEDF